MNILYPTNNYPIIDKLPVKTSVESRYPIKEVDFYINNNLIYSDFNTPYEYEINFNNLNNIERGDILLSIRAYDRYDNIGESNITLIK